MHTAQWSGSYYDSYHIVVDHLPGWAELVALSAGWHNPERDLEVPLGLSATRCTVAY